MTHEKQSPVGFAWWLRVKRNMVIFGAIAVGAPAGLFMAWRFGELRGPGFGLFVLVISLLGGALWGLLMWHFFAFQFPSMRDAGSKRNRAGG